MICARTLLLYSIQFLHQITTDLASCGSRRPLYSIQFLHQITTITDTSSVVSTLYSIQFLHQITTSGTTLIDYKGITSVCAAKKAMFGELRKSIRCSFSVLQNKYIKKIPVVEVFRDRRVRPCPRNSKSRCIVCPLRSGCSSFRKAASICGPAGYGPPYFPWRRSAGRRPSIASSRNRPFPMPCETGPRGAVRFWYGSAGRKIRIAT